MGFRGIFNTTLPSSNQLTPETPLIMSQKTSWQNTDALLTPRTKAMLRRMNPWPEVQILHLKVMTRRVRPRRRLVLETIIHFRLFFLLLLILNTPLVIIRSMVKRRMGTVPFQKEKGIPQRPPTQKWPLRARKRKRRGLKNPPFKKKKKKKKKKS